MNARPLRMIRYCGRRRWANGFSQPLASWLGKEERRELERLRDQDRRQQWLQGRWLGKELMVAATGCPFKDIEITARNEAGRGVAPEIRVAGEPALWRLSISHSALGVLAALAPAASWRLGVDLTGAAPDHSGFRQLWFTPAERAWLASRPRVRTSQLWALKESIYKACNDGEPWTPRAIEVRMLDDGACEGTFFGRPLVGLQSRIHTIDGQTAAVVYLPCSRALSPYDRTLPISSCL